MSLFYPARLASIT